MNTEEYGRLLRSLKEHATKIHEDGLEIEVRSCADREAGKADPRSAAAAGVTRDDFLHFRERLHPQLWANETHLLGPEHVKGDSKLEFLRAQFGWISSDMSTGIRTTSHEMAYAGENFRLYQYEILSTATDRPALIFIHGGGFFGGDIATVENQCKLLAQLSGGVVFSVDYPLSPEHPYPAGFDACYEALRWVHAHAAGLGIAADKIGMAGDSAGGNLTLACALRDRMEGTHMLSYEALIYPGSHVGETLERPVCWRPELYDNPGQDALIEAQIRVIGETSVMAAAWYIPEGVDITQPGISPILADLSGLPKTTVMTAEYDFLRASCEALSRKLTAAGVETRHIRYGGIFHGTFDRLGYAPQVEDMLREIALDLKNL